MKQDKFADAELQLQRVLRRREKALGPDHRETLRTARKLVALYMKQGKRVEAKPLIERAKKMK
jgi:hypothetical protein